MLITTRLTHKTHNGLRWEYNQGGKAIYTERWVLPVKMSKVLCMQATDTGDAKVNYGITCDGRVATIFGATEFHGASIVVFGVQ